MADRKKNEGTVDFLERKRREAFKKFPNNKKKRLERYYNSIGM